jgi:rubredoxin
LLDDMKDTFEKVMANPDNLLRPYAMFRELQQSSVCPECLGAVDYQSPEEIYVCRRCGARRETHPGEAFLQPVRSKN